MNKNMKLLSENIKGNRYKEIIKETSILRCLCGNWIYAGNTCEICKLLERKG